MTKASAPRRCGSSSRQKLGTTALNSTPEGDTARPSVTAVIPSTGRASLARAVESALGQDDVQMTVFVPGTADALERASAVLGDLMAAHPEAVRLIELPDGAKGGYGRAQATAEATTQFVAYLDDDDWWHRSKSAAQVNALTDDQVLVSCRSWLVDAEEPETALGTTPQVVFDPAVHTDVGDYLFRSRRLSAGRNLLHTSTLLVRTTCAQESNWDRELPRHQDWDFVLGISQQWGRDALVQLPEPLVYIETGTGASVSARRDWRPSYDWYRDQRDAMSDAAGADFLIGQVARYAMQSSDYASVRALVNEARKRHWPSSTAWAMMMAGALPRRTFEHVALVSSRLREAVKRS